MWGKQCHYSCCHTEKFQCSGRIIKQATKHIGSYTITVKKINLYLKAKYIHQIQQPQIKEYTRY